MVLGLTLYRTQSHSPSVNLEDTISRMFGNDMGKSSLTQPWGSRDQEDLCQSKNPVIQSIPSVGLNITEEVTFSLGLFHSSRFSSSRGRFLPFLLPNTHQSHSFTQAMTSRCTRSSPTNSINRCGRYRSTHNVFSILTVDGDAWGRGSLWGACQNSPVLNRLGKYLMLSLAAVPRDKPSISR